MIGSNECKTPGCCTCPNMARCQGCGYTQHDKLFWLDHSLCEVEIAKKRARDKKERAEVR